MSSPPSSTIPPTRDPANIPGPIHTRTPAGFPFDALYTMVQGYAEVTNTAATNFKLAYPLDQTGAGSDMSAPATGYEWAILMLHLSCENAGTIVDLRTDGGGGGVIWKIELPEGAGFFPFERPGFRFGAGNKIPMIKQDTAGDLYARAQFIQVPVR